MRSGIRTTIALLGLLLLTTNTFASTTSVPGKLEPVQLRWKDGVVRIAVSSSLADGAPGIKIGSDVLGALRRSIASWEAAADVKFVVEVSDLQNVSASGVSGDGVSLLTIAASSENLLLFSRDPFSASARTRVFYNRRGSITEADIVLNPYQQFSTDGTAGTFDLEATLTHELGHLLGLRHSSVLGAVMSEGLARNNGTGSPLERMGGLADPDIAAARDLYGYFDDQVECCSSISGRLIQIVKSPKVLNVWAEDNTSGRVVAHTETQPDGSYRLGGLLAGNYSIFWKAADRTEVSRIGQLGTVKLAANENHSLSGKVSSEPSDLALSFIGLNNELADSAITIGGAREYTVFLGGRALELEDLRVEFNSPYFRAVPGSIKRYDLGEKLSAVSFLLAADEHAPAGVYSLFLTGDDSILAAMVGGIRVAPRSDL